MAELEKFFEVDTDNEAIKLNGQLLMPQNNQQLGPIPYVIDRGVEAYGSNNSSIVWTFEKRSDGFAKCSGIAQFTNVTCTTSGHGGYINGGDVGVEFPKDLFNSDPIVSVTAAGSAGTGHASLLRVVTALNEPTNNREVKMKFVNTVSNSNKSINAYIMAEGTWK